MFTFCNYTLEVLEMFFHVKIVGNIWCVYPNYIILCMISVDIEKYAAVLILHRK